ncbi:PIH1 domain-containing protein Nop17-like [Lycorma delicatula]|uniref:PIH1 domain-containing protein Nop17-like n=1 Tax=Lycorma delicatula TaxID=130591 RepID=UPI003F517E46
MASFQTRQHKSFEDLEITKDELNQIGDALKKEEFRKLLHDYVDEITDPENQKLFEKEITELERERGNDVTFIHPSPGYVIKTSIDGEKKAFINVCYNDNIMKPSNSRKAGGVQWSLPYTQAQPREDLDKKNNVCMVFDVVFHPDVIRMVKENHRFKEMVSDTAMNAVEKSFNVTLDKKNVRYPKVMFKGLKHATVIRKKSKHHPKPQSEDCDHGVFEIPNYPYPPLSEESVTAKETKIYVPVKKPEDEFTVPKYVIKQRNNIDIQDCTNSVTSKINAAIPNELVVNVELPLIKSASDVTLDVTEKSLKLVSEKPAKYKLDITLPYTVEEDKGNAKFDSRTKKLIITLVVKRINHAPNLFELSREDSGVDSDMGSGFRSTESSSGEDEPVNCQDKLVRANDEHEICDMVNSYRTKKSDEFLNSDKHYSFPSYDCNVLKNILAFTFHIRNVEPDSVESKHLDGNSGFHLKFSSIGSGHFPINYSFCVKLLNKVKLDNENLSVEVWDNNVIAQINLIGCDNEEISEYFCGVDENSLEKHVLPNPIKLMEIIQKETEDLNTLNTQKIEIVKFEEDNVFLEISNSVLSLCIEENDSKNVKNKDVKKNVDELKSGMKEEENIKIEECTQETTNEVNVINNDNMDINSCSKVVTVSPRIKASPRCLSRTFSESQTDKAELKPYRGILKVGRSLSESSVDYYHWSSSSVENSDPNCTIEKIKKTVRFSESISRKTYRTNSSILGQRKKNQRKSRNKKRAQERRASESENSEGEVDEVKNNEERDLKSDEETSETQSDISESDDCMKIENRDVISLSKRNHKRGGKKSARKSANAAKMAFTNNLMFDLDM